MKRENTKQRSVAKETGKKETLSCELELVDFRGKVAGSVFLCSGREDLVSGTFFQTDPRDNISAHFSQMALHIRPTVKEKGKGANVAVMILFNAQGTLRLR